MDEQRLSSKIEQVRLTLKSFDHPEMDAVLNEGFVGRILQESAELDRQFSFAALVWADLADGSELLLHRSAAYRFGGFAVLADAWTHDYARLAGLHLPCLATRVMYCTQVDELPAEKILVLPQLGPDWSHKMKGFGFERMTCSVKQGLPPKIREPKQPVFNLSTEGLALMRETASLPFHSEADRFMGIDFVNTTFIGRWNVRRGLRGQGTPHLRVLKLI